VELVEALPRTKLDKSAKAATMAATLQQEGVVP
jgi:hypothetical protein